MPGPWEKYQTASADSSGPWDKFKAVPEKPSLVSNIASKVGDAGQAFFAGASEAVPFSNVLDKAGAGVAAGLQSATDIFRSPPDRKSLEEHYDQALKFIKGERATDIAKNPVAAKAGEVVGGVAPSLLIPIPGAGMAGLAGAGARVAGTAGLSALERGTSGDKLFDPSLATQGGLTGGAISAGLEAIPIVGKAAKPVTDKMGELIQDAGKSLGDLAATKAVKASLGNSAKAWRLMGDRVQPVGEELLSTSEGPAVVQFGDSASKIADRATEALKKTWGKIEDIHNQADSLGVTVNGEDIASKILDKASKIKDVPQNQGLINSLQEQALFYEHKGDIPLSTAQEFKNQYVWKMPTGNAAKDVLGKDGNNAVKSAIGETMKETVANSNLPGKESYPDLLNKYGAYASAAGPAAETALREAKNRSISLTDYLAGDIGSHMIHSGDHAVDATASGLFALGNKILRERGNSSVASAANKLGDILESAPQTLAKYSNILTDAIQNGPAGFIAAHEVLMNDPKYRALIGQSKSPFERMIQQKYGSK